jgi:hypothetical protein
MGKPEYLEKTTDLQLAKGIVLLANCPAVE